MLENLTGLAVAGLLSMSPATPALADVFVPLDAKATYLHTNESTATPAAPALRLADHGFAPGDRLLLEVVGDIDNGPGGDTFTFTLGLFSSSSVLLAPSELHRVPGAIASDGVPFVTARTYFGAQPTDIAQDFGFDVPAGTVVTVPAGAVFLFLAKNDQLYQDNSDPDHDYGVRIGFAPPVPEPHTWALFAAGLTAIGRRAWRARRT